jgi:hypothetical protein
VGFIKGTKFRNEFISFKSRYKRNGYEHRRNLTNTLGGGDRTRVIGAQMPLLYVT